MKKMKIDWFKAKRDLLLDPSTSLKNVAKKYGFSYSKIKKVSASREWHKDKKLVQALVSEALMKEIKNDITEKLKKVGKKALQTTEAKMIQKEEKMYKRIFK